MKFLFLAMIFTITSCSVVRTRTYPAISHPHVEKPGKEISKKESAPTATTAKGTAWELLSMEKLTLQFKNVDDESNLTVILEEGITEKEIPAGHWELTGFEVDGTSYLSMNTSKKFVMRTKANARNYGGSYILGCPKVSLVDSKALKQMKFFDRYPFSASKGLCELVIGNNMISVRNSLRKTKKLKRLNLIMTF